MAQREATQPIRAKTGGSTFKNPPGHKAWQLIDEAGCRGLMRGRRPGQREALQFPHQYRRGHAPPTSRRWAKRSAPRVKAKSGIELEWEIKRVGVADGARMTASSASPC